MIIICSHKLDENEECIVYTSIVVAKTIEHHRKRLYENAEIKGVIGQMLEIREPGITKSSKFKSYSPKVLVQRLRDPYDPWTQRLKEKASGRLEQHLEDVSRFLEQYHEVPIQDRNTGPLLGPQSFRIPGNMQKLKIHGTVLSPLQLSIIYAASNLILSRFKKPFSILEIKKMVAVMLNIEGSHNFKTYSIAQYIDVFRDEADHWLTKKVADETKGDRLTEACIDAIALFEESGCSGACKGDFASTTRSALVPSEYEDEDSGGEDEDEDSDDEDPSVAPLSQGLMSVNLDAPVQPQNLRSSARGSSSGVLEPLAGQNTCHYSNSAYNKPAYNIPTYNSPAYSIPAYNTPAYDRPAYNDPTYNRPTYNSPADQQHPGQQYLYSSIDPQYPTNIQHRGQQSSPLGSENLYTRYEYPQLSFTDTRSELPQLSFTDTRSKLPQSQRPAYNIDRNDPRYWPPPPPQSPYTTSPYAPVPAQGLNSQSGYDPAQTGVFDQPTPPPPQRRRLEDQESQEKGETGQRYAVTGEETGQRYAVTGPEKARKDDRHAGGSQEMAKKDHGKEKKGGGPRRG